MVLGIDTSSKSASCALVKDQKVVCDFFSNTDFQHSKTIMPMIKAMFDCAEVKPEEIKAIGVTVGPGSFTGVRIGAAAAKGIALPFDIPCVAVSSLQAAAMGVSEFNGIICPVMDARCNLKRFNKPVLLVGDGARIFYSAAQNLVENISVSPPGNLFPKAGNVALIAEQDFNNGKTVSADRLEPLYLRPPQAVRNLKKQ